MNTIRKIILDTDIGPDCDDCGALAILDQYHKAGKAELLGVVHCTSDLNSVNVIAAINDYFGVDGYITPWSRSLTNGFFRINVKFAITTTRLP